MCSVGAAMKCSQRYERAFLGQESLTMSNKCFKCAGFCCKKNTVQMRVFVSVLSLCLFVFLSASM